METSKNDLKKLYPIFYMSPTSGKCQSENITPSKKKRRSDITDSSDDQITPKQITPRRKMQLRLTPVRNKEQLYLDLGQNKFGHVECQRCRMVYTNGQIEDISVHNKFHNTVDDRIIFKGWRDERVVEQYDEGRILIVLPSDSKKHIKKIDEILTIVDNELGYNGYQSHIKSKTKSFLFVSNHKEVIGYVMAEEITQAYELSLTDDDKENQSSLSRENWCCSDNPTKAVLGIMRVWVSATHRRRGVATRLLDTVRKHHFFAYTVPKQLMAFSDPTPDGRSLAVRYCEASSVLVYKWTV